MRQFKSYYLLLIIIKLYMSSGLVAQQDSMPFADRFSLMAGTSYRFAPIEVGPAQYKEFLGIDSDIDKSVAGQRIGAGLKFLAIRKYGISIINRIEIRHGHIYYEPNPVYNNAPPGYLVHTINNSTFTMDQYLMIQKQLTFENFGLNLELGFSWLNKGSEYSYFHKTNASSGWMLQYDFEYSGVYGAITAEYKSFVLGFDLLYVDVENHLFYNEKSFFTPGVNFYYHFNRKK